MQAVLKLQATYCPPPAFLNKKAEKPTAAQKLGLKYEERALAMAQEWAVNNRYHIKIKPWIKFTNVLGETKHCQPDAVLISLDTDNLLILEIKHRHCREAFNQLRKYKDMMLELHPDYHTSCIEVCRYFDASEYSVTLISEIRPHAFPFAAVIWEPSPCRLDLN